MSDRVAVMSSGHIEQLDEPRAIYDRPLTPFVAEFIGEMNFFDGEVTASGDGTFTRGRRTRASWCAAAARPPRESGSRSASAPSG